MPDDATPHAPQTAAGQEAARDFSARAHRLIPGGAHTYSKGDDQFPANAPRGRVRGKATRVWNLNRHLRAAQIDCPGAIQPRLPA